MKKAVLIISHGSYSPKTIKEIKTLVEILKKKSAVKIFHYAFLEIASPSIPQGIDICVDEGAEEVVILLNFLNSGKHVDQDIPRIIEEARLKHPKVKISMTKPVGQHVGIVDLFLDLIK
jgi:sirohydrochlorin ferrochelatase